MALRKKAQSISIDKVRSGQVLEISYTSTGGSTDTAMILVVDPNYKGKLHAIKLTNLNENDMESLIYEMRSVSGRTRNISETDKMLMYDTFKNTPYVSARPYRTYIKSNIQSIKRITLGQPSDATTVKYSLGSSVLYGVTHGNIVHVAYDDHEVLHEELYKNSYATYFEGGLGHEEVTTALLKLLLGNVNYTQYSWEPVHIPELYLITELFGAEGDTTWEQINDAIADRKLEVADKKLIEIVAETSSGGNKQWSDRKDRAYTVAEIQELLNVAVGDTSLYNKNFSEVSKEEFIKFQKRMMIQAFAGYEGKPGEKFVGSPFEMKQKAITTYRQTHLINMMQTKPGVYFAGLSHVEDLIKGI